jgi:hypothetical protein
MMRGWLAALGFAAMAWVTAAGCTTTIVEGGGCPASRPELTTACGAAGALCDYPDSSTCATTYLCADDGLWALQSSTCPTTDCEEGADGGYCAEVGQSCGESGECGGFETTCGEDHTWSTTWYDELCCGGGGSCPDTLPLASDSCDPCSDSTSCSYPTDCGVAVASCSPDGSWLIEPGDCPPPPSSGCEQLLDEASCATSPECRWLVPGCGTPQLPAAGCFPSADCAPGSCGDPATTCQTVIHDPCYNKGCDACSAPVSLCLP